MAKGKLKAEEMFERDIGSANRPTKEETLKLMRKFSKQETEWWEKHCDKWEKAYSELLKETSL